MERSDGPFLPSRRLLNSSGSGRGALKLDFVRMVTSHRGPGGRDGRKSEPFGENVGLDVYINPPR